MERLKYYVFLIAIVSITYNSPAYAADKTDGFAPDRNIRIIVADENMNLDYLKLDTPPFIMDGHTLVPLRAIVEEFGYQVHWDNILQSVTLNNGEINISMTVGTNAVEVNGISEEMAVAPRIVNNRTMIPLRFVSEQFGQYVEWGRDESAGISYIWITRLKLLSGNDFTNLMQDYEELYHSDGWPEPYYVLLETGKTSRGIIIGSRAEDVVEAYGVPHRVECSSGANQAYIYYEPGIPFTDFRRGLTFFLDGTKVVRVQTH